MCEVGAGLEVDKDALWEAWKDVVHRRGADTPGTKAVFARDLRAAVPGLTPIRPRDGEAALARLARPHAETIDRTPDHP